MFLVAEQDHRVRYNVEVAII